jgi:hypothetical protein
MEIKVIITHKEETDKAWDKQWEYQINDVQYKQWNEIMNSFAEFINMAIIKINNLKKTAG